MPTLVVFCTGTVSFNEKIASNMPTINVRPSEHVSVLTESISLPILSLTPNASCPVDPFSKAYLHIIPAIVNTNLNIVSVMIHERCIGKRGGRFFCLIMLPLAMSLQTPLLPLRIRRGKGAWEPHPAGNFVKCVVSLSLPYSIFITFFYRYQGCSELFFLEGKLIFPSPANTTTSFLQSSLCKSTIKQRSF